jgi:hypothetical protein
MPKKTTSTRAKQKGVGQQIDTQGDLLLRATLPQAWQVRPYQPDFGLDYAVEIFDKVPGTANLETMGEHIFVQLKTKSDIDPKPLKIRARTNVEKADDTGDGEVIGTMHTYRIPLEMSEIVTVERMGVGVPVLLVVADLKRKRCCFVCINDTIDKILIPRYGKLGSAASRTIHIPVANDLSTECGIRAFRWYAIRAKLFAAFQRFGFQYHELDITAHEVNPLDVKRQAAQFARRIVNNDIWQRTDLWPMLEGKVAAIQRLIDTGTVGYIRLAEPLDLPSPGEREAFEIADILTLWQHLDGLSKSYEDMYREAYLPTGMGMLLSKNPGAMLGDLNISLQASAAQR